jgi:hypothetical protein
LRVAAIAFLPIGIQDELSERGSKSVRWWLAISSGVAALLMGLCVWLLAGSKSMEVAPGTVGPSDARGTTQAVPQEPRGEAESSSRRAQDVAPSPSKGAAEAEAHLGALVRVVHASNGAPAAGARVWVEREGRDDAQWSQTWLELGDLGAVLASGLGEEHTADERGIVRLPLPEGGLWVSAELGRERGEGRVERGALECTIQIAPVRKVEVLTVDQSGNPLAGVQVAIVLPTAPGWGEIARGVTGSNGRRVLHVDSEAADTIDPAPILAPMLVQSEPAGVDVQPGNLPQDVVRFVIGAHGRVVVRAVDGRGELRRSRGHVGLGADAKRNLDLAPAQAAGPWFDRPLVDGEAVFERVGVGIALRTWVEARGFEAAVADVEGPPGPGAERLIEVPLLEPRWSVRGRALEEDGEPLGAARVWGWLSVDGARGEQVLGVWTDEQGHFEDRGGTALAGAPAGTAVELEGARDGEVARRGFVRLPLPDDEGVLDLGAIAMSPIGLVASGRVALPDGKPVSNAEVFVVGTSLVGRSSPEGLFAISGDAPSASFELVARDWLFLSAPPVPARAGEQNVVVPMRRGARLGGQLLLPADLPAASLRMVVEVEPDSAGASAPWRFEDSHLGVGGEFELSPLETGLGRFAVGLGDTELTLAEGLRLREGELCRLERIDLGARLAMVHLTCVDETGQPLTSGEVHCLGPGGERTSSQPLRVDGTVAIAALEPRVDVEVEVPARPAARFAGAADGDRLVVPAGVRVTFALAALPALPPGAALRVRARNGSGVHELSAHAIAAGSGAGELLLGAARTWSLRWSLVRQDGRETELASGAPATLEVGSEPGELHVDASVDAEELARALAGP